MREDVSFTERRQHKRFRPKNMSLALSKDLIGEIVDVSEGGMAFRYVNKSGNGLNMAYISLVTTDGFLMENLPISTVSDFATCDYLPSHGVHMRQRGVKFGNLNQFQRDELETFMLLYTNSAAEAEN